MTVRELKEYMDKLISFGAGEFEVILSEPWYGKSGINNDRREYTVAHDEDDIGHSDKKVYVELERI